MDTSGSGDSIDDYRYSGEFLDRRILEAGMVDYCRINLDPHICITSVSPLHTVPAEKTSAVLPRLNLSLPSAAAAGPLSELPSFSQ